MYLHAVFRGRRDNALILRLQIIRMHKVDIGRIRTDSVEQPSPDGKMKVVPSDMGHLQPLGGGNPHNPALQDTEPFHAGALLAAFEQKLQPQADAQEGPPAVHIPANHLVQAVSPQLAHGVPESAYPRQNHALRPQDHVCVPGDDALLPQKMQGLLHALDIACVIVDYRNHNTPMLN